ncbi:class I adenylate-forming enzyme family protein [Nocardioides sp. KR10-350]|uniref:class I adenylate-forming enzyme family protein n=1 Tax=Nocardioides cheoyonin TaxID=3156615 RepID=UPI0032B3711F
MTATTQPAQPAPAVPFEPLPPADPGLGTRTLAHVLLRAAREHPDTVAVSVEGEPAVTYAELLDRARGLAASLERRAPQARHVGLLLPNGAAFVVGLYAAALARRTAVLLNPRLRDPELVYQVGQSQVGVLIAADAPGRPLASLFPALEKDHVDPAVIWAGSGTPPTGEPLEDWLADVPEPAAGPGDLPDEEDVAVIIYTSGSTALPKGVMLRHRSVVRNAEVVAERFGATDRDRVFSAGPFFHSGGLTMQLVLAALVGAPAYSVAAFDPTTVLDIVEREQITLYSGIETLFLRLTEARGFARERLASVRSGWTTGTPAILHAIADEVGIPGVICIYGISEAAPNVTMSPADDTPEHRLETVGRPQDGTEVRLLDPVTGEDVGIGRPGEIAVRSYGVMAGYWDKPAETAEALAGGWLHTGDLAVRRPDGYLSFAGRIKDIVRVGGENVSCSEVENALYGLGGIELASVIPVDDGARGQRVVAAVRMAEGAPFDEDGMIAALRGRLAGYKVPSRIVHVPQMPLTESGKVVKRRLAEVVEPLLGQR